LGVWNFNNYGIKCKRWVFEVLVEKDIESLNHANRVITTYQFLRYGSLISRGIIERKKWRQTAQISDEMDKEFSVWNDVFVNAVTCVYP
jgi:hypothetical protein